VQGCAVTYVQENVMCLMMMVRFFSKHVAQKILTSVSDQLPKTQLNSVINVIQWTQVCEVMVTEQN
jgi:hypothetical protein